VVAYQALLDIGLALFSVPQRWRREKGPGFHCLHVEFHQHCRPSICIGTLVTSKTDTKRYINLSVQLPQ